MFAGSGGKYLFHRIGRKGRVWQPCLIYRRPDLDRLLLSESGRFMSSLMYCKMVVIITIILIVVIIAVLLIVVIIAVLLIVVIIAILLIVVIIYIYIYIC